MEKFQLFFEDLPGLALSWGIKLIVAIIILVIGLWVIKWFLNGIRGIAKKRQIDDSLTPFIISLVGITLRLILFLIILGTLGVQMSSFIAILAAAGLAIGMALSGTLQNFAGSFIIILFKPFKVGDYIQAQGFFGTVQEVQMFNTILLTPDNRTIIIPNGGLSTGPIENFSTEDRRRVDISIKISYSESYEEAKNVIESIILSEEAILPNPRFFVGITKLDDGAVEVTLRAWVMSKDFWNVYFSLNEKLKEAFKNTSLAIPIPVKEIHKNI